MVTSENLKAHILQIAVDELGYYNPPVSGIFCHMHLIYNVIYRLTQLCEVNKMLFILSIQL